MDGVTKPTLETLFDMAWYKLVNNGPGNGLSPDGTKQLPEQMLTTGLQQCGMMRK